ncbi:protein jag [Desulfonatronovibrio magnus]|uniref:Jag family protein n=1 Tax=Desulfonatronovibrio magnus TaxID=698827 RepID=UPI0005EBCD05|nr:protein jag [Desulfonatronovibrio magnus]
MEDYVEFSGKDVDDAIAIACKHYGIDRDKLEIEIVSGGSSGIFGLVGVKKARIMARKRGGSLPAETDSKLKASQLRKDETKDQPAEAKNKKSEKTIKERPPKEFAKKPKAANKDNKKHPVQKAGSEQVKAEPEVSAPTEVKESTKQNHHKPAAEPQSEKAVLNQEPREESTEKQAGDPALRDYIQGLMNNLIGPLSPEAEITIDDSVKPISVIIKDENTSELFIGRDGQTLSAIQYIANRIIAKNWPGAARVQLDTEDFLEKQTEKLQKNAHLLAQKAKKIGKTMSTRPLSSYHRRIVHMALQSDKKIRTKSKGDGPMKRVLIMPRNKRRKPPQE